MQVLWFSGIAGTNTMRRMRRETVAGPACREVEPETKISPDQQADAAPVLDVSAASVQQLVKSYSTALTAVKAAALFPKDVVFNHDQAAVAEVRPLPR